MVKNIADGEICPERVIMEKAVVHNWLPWALCGLSKLLGLGLQFEEKKSAFDFQGFAAGQKFQKRNFCPAVNQLLNMYIILGNWCCWCYLTLLG